MITYEDFDTPEARRTNYLVDLYEGNQLKYVEQALNGGMGGGKGERNNWLKKGYVPRMRNIVKPIVEKSAMLFNEPPKYEILPGGTAKPVVDETLNEILAVADFQEFSVNLDNYTRLLGATCVLVQRYIPVPEVETVGGIYVFDSDRGDTMVPILLHQGNCVVRMNQTRTRILELAYITKGCIDDDRWEYREITPYFITDYVVYPAKAPEDRVVVLLQQPNEAKAVTANMWYDTAKPRAGVWPRVSEDLISAQEQVNSHLTDMEYARARQLGQSLFLVNADVETGTEPAPVVVQETNYEGNPTQRPADTDESGLDLGIGSVVSITTPKGSDKSTSVSYDGPSVNLTEQAEVVRKLLEDLAGDWCVTLKVAGDAGATSGFQLIVEEMDNLQLRERRGQTFQASFRRFYELMRVLYPELQEGQLQVIFAAASLPVNKKEELDLWVTKIEAGLATREDFLETEEGLSEEEAAARVAEINAQNATKEDLPALLTLLSKGVLTPQQLADEMARRGLLATGTKVEMTPEQLAAMSTPLRTGSRA